jgi:hypothetical protein
MARGEWLAMAAAFSHDAAGAVGCPYQHGVWPQLGHRYLAPRNRVNRGISYLSHMLNRFRS